MHIRSTQVNVLTAQFQFSTYLLPYDLTIVACRDSDTIILNSILGQIEDSSEEYSFQQMVNINENLILQSTLVCGLERNVSLSGAAVVTQHRPQV